MSAAKPLLVALVLTTLALAGCVASDPPGVDPIDMVKERCVAEEMCGDAVVDASGRDLRVDLLANDTLEAPTWEVGDVFEQHLYYGSADTQGEHIQTMVVDDAGGCYQLGTTSQEAARTEATFDMPILGCIDKGDLETSGFGTDWSWMYDFPISEGKSWTGAITEIFNWNSNTFHSYDFTLTATYTPQIDGFEGIFPGFQITGTTADGEVLLEYDYVPAIGWFAHFYMYDLAADDPTDVMFHAMSMGTSEDWTGTYYIDDSETAIETFYLPGLSVLADEEPRATFTVPEGSTYLMGVVVPMACPGVSKVVLVSPSQEVRQYDHQTTVTDPCVAMLAENEDPGAQIYTVHWFDESAEVGDWGLFHAGAGVSGYYIWLEAITEHAYELTEADLPTDPDAAA